MLEAANIKLASVATDVMGVSGRQILQAMVEGVQDPKALAAMAGSSRPRWKLPVVFRGVPSMPAALRQNDWTISRASKSSGGASAA